MLCIDPYMKGVIACGCGKCPPCKINRRRQWAGRIMLESRLHEKNAFVTLTYDEKHLPEKNELDPREPQLFIKRLRRAYDSVGQFRFYLAGEYGKNTRRPHYHIALFGFPTCQRGRTEHRLKYCCAPCDTVQRSWARGGVDLGQLNKYSASYIAKYLTKGGTSERIWKKNGSKGIYPEFTRMSLRPGGIGAAAISAVSNSIKSAQKDGAVFNNLTDVPGILRANGSLFPMGRYLKGKLIEKLGYTDDQKKQFLKQYVSEMSELYNIQLQEEKTKGKIHDGGVSRKSVLKQLYSHKSQQKITDVIKKFKMLEKESKL